jgi:hypothetical protein
MAAPRVRFVEADYGDGAPSDVTAVWEAELLPGWKVTTRWRLVNGVVTIREFHVAPTDDGDPEAAADTTVAKRLGLGELERATRSAFASPFAGFVFPREWLDAIEREEFRPRPGRGRARHRYAEWARRYVDALERDPRAPIALLSKEWPDETEESLRGFLTRARKLGLLTQAPPGKPGGKLTDKARVLLAEEED